jgi:membrane associated rhomboid family serine protease
LFPLRDNIPTRRFPIVTVAIMVICIAVFFGFQEAHWDGGGFAVKDTRTVEYAYIPYEFTHMGKECAGVFEGERAVKLECQGKGGFDSPVEDQPSVWLTILFAMFMHGGLLHIAGNMLFLWIFGNNIEDSMGRVTFVAFYLLGGLAATLLQTVVNPDSAVPNLGASGAIAAVLGGYALLYPRARVVTLIFIVFFVTVLELPALLVLGAWFVLQLLDASAASGGDVGGVAYFAHIGGFLFGLATIKLFARNAKDDYVEPRLPVY